MELQAERDEIWCKCYPESVDYTPYLEGFVPLDLPLSQPEMCTAGGVDMAYPMGIPFGFESTTQEDNDSIQQTEGPPAL
jgi:hypothetical protein